MGNGPQKNTLPPFELRREGADHFVQNHAMVSATRSSSRPRPIPLKPGCCRSPGQMPDGRTDAHRSRFHRRSVCRPDLHLHRPVFALANQALFQKHCIVVL